MKVYIGTKGERYVNWAAIDIQQDTDLTFVLMLLLAHIIHQYTVPKKEALQASNKQHGKLISSSKAYQKDKEGTGHAH